MAAQALLCRLELVRRTGEGRWVARCPSHDDRGPSLSIREIADGRTLVYCFAGCEARDVLGAVGATWADLFPPRKPTDQPQRRRREPLTTAADAMRCIAFEAILVGIVAADLARGQGLAETDRRRLLEAAGRIARAKDAANA